MGKFSRWCVVSLALVVVSGELPSEMVVPQLSSGRAAAAAPLPVPDPGKLAPIGVAGAADGEDAVSVPVDDRVLLEPPTDAKPVAVSLADRLAVERAAAPRPAVVGLDAEL